MTDFGKAKQLDDDPVIPGEFAPRTTRLRDSETPFNKGRRSKVKDQERSDNFNRIKAELLRIRPDFNCDWESTSDAMLQGILNIEATKHDKHFSMRERPVLVNKQQEDTNAQILAGIKALTDVVTKLNRRVSKLEKPK